MSNNTISLTGIRPGTQITVIIPEEFYSGPCCFEAEAPKVPDPKPDPQRLSDDELFAVHRMLRSSTIGPSCANTTQMRDLLATLTALMNRLDKDFPENRERGFQMHVNGPRFSFFLKQSPT